MMPQCDKKPDKSIPDEKNDYAKNTSIPDKSQDGNYVETVLGPTRMSKLGTILTHEYLVCDFSDFHMAPLYESPYDFTSFSLKNIGYVRQYPYSYLCNLRLNDKEGIPTIFKEVELFKQSNGGTIVDKTSRLNRNLGLLKSISSTTDVNIIIGTGYHISDTKNLMTCTKTIEEMYNSIQKEMQHGCETDFRVKPAFIAEGGDILLDFEIRALRAMAECQGEIRCPVSFHPGKYVIPLTEVMRIYQEAGGIDTELVMAHVDRGSFSKSEDIMEFIRETQCYIQFDQFGVESSFYQLNPRTDIMSDTQSIELIAKMKAEGKLQRVLMSHDIHTKHRLVTFGGLGYTHISNNITPLMLKRDFTLDDIYLIRNENPYRWLNRLNL